MYLRFGTAVMLTLAATGLRADFTYEETTRITGGAMVSMMRFAGAFSKDASKAMEPIHSTISVKGNRMVHKTPTMMTITDLDAETITTVNFDKKTYSVMTFAQMKEAMEQMAQKMKQGAPNGGDVEWDVKMDDTGQHKNINGSDAHEIIMTMSMKATDAKSGAQGVMNMKSDMWIAPKVDGYGEVKEFYKRMASKMEFMSVGGNPFMNRPDMARAMSAMMKEGSKMDGMPMQTIVKMQGDATNLPQNSGEQQQSARSNSAPPPTSLSGALGSALAGRLGRRKQQDSQGDASSGNAAPGDPNSLMEMTTEVSSYSSGPVNAAQWEVPSDFKKVESDLNRMNSRGR